ncbi:SGNH hydrolase-type esterase domain-containing protein [Paraphoma chrysanthemicola]|nr:SGNH hydrolase-type esterase domain-containing protein [Paraphoma chrysanthemicola]
MRFSSLLALLPLACAAPAALIERAPRPVYWVLAGDSTTATAGGWGDAFLSTTVAAGSSGRNLGKSGASTRSFRAGGNWANVLSEVNKNKANYNVYVTIQFGHNDQKAGSGVTIDQYATNLGVFADDVKKAGGIPILVSPLTRRTFSGGKVVQNLANETARTLAVAKQKGLHVIDLNKASTDYVQAIGASAADQYNLSQGDRTHVNERGGVVFSRIVSDLLVAGYPNEFSAVTKPNASLSALIKAGKPY